MAGEPRSRGLLRWISKRTEGGSRLENALRRYAGERVDLGLQEWIAYAAVRLAVSGALKALGIPRERVVEALGDPTVRRGVVNVLEGIAYYGVRRPQVTAAPFLVVWDFTRMCNLRCKHCYASAAPKPDPDELTTEEAKKAVDEFAKAGVVAIAFSGGEPLARRDFLEVAGYAADRGFYVAVATNGTLITREVARKMKEAGVRYVEVSLDGLERTHDEFRGVPGAWRRAVEGVRNCVEAGLDVGIAVTATRHSLGEIPKLLELAERELHAKRFVVFNFVPVGRGKGIVD